MKYHNLHIRTMSDGTYASFSDGEKTVSPMAVYEPLLATRTTRPPLSDFSGLTGLRFPSKAMTNEEPIEWGDMDPALVRDLRQNPAKMKVLLATRKSKQPRLEYQNSGEALFVSKSVFFNGPGSSFGY